MKHMRLISLLLALVLMLGVLPGFVKSNPAAAAELLGVASYVGNNHYHELYLSWMNSLSGKTEFVEYNRTRYLKVNSASEDF